jgi:uroporphyrinogen decarboxylase
MLSRERVIAVIEGKTPDKIPIYGWLKENLKDVISAKYGSVEAFEDKYEFDFAHIFGGPGCYNKDRFAALIESCNGEITPEDLLSIDMADVNDMSKYENIKKSLEHHKIQRGRFTYVQTPGIFEANNTYFGIQNHLLYLALYPEELKLVYERQAKWNRQFALNCIDLGVDMVHISDDWGAQNSLLFSPDVWRELMYPYHKFTIDAVKKTGTYVSLHSDGNIMQVLDGIVELGFDVIHPYQESAGMSYDVYFAKYKDYFALMGGLDVQTVIGFGKLDLLKSNIERIINLFKKGHLLLCTSHFVQAHCTLEELESVKA